MKEDLEDRFYLGPLSIDIQGDKEIGDRYVNTAKSMLTMLKMRMNNVGITYGMDNRSIAVFAEEGGKQTHWVHLKVMTNRNGLVDQDSIRIDAAAVTAGGRRTKRILGYTIQYYTGANSNLHANSFNTMNRVYIEADIPDSELFNENIAEEDDVDYELNEDVLFNIDFDGFPDNGAKYVNAVHVLEYSHSGIIKPVEWESSDVQIVYVYEREGYAFDVETGFYFDDPADNYHRYGGLPSVIKAKEDSGVILGMGFYRQDDDYVLAGEGVNDAGMGAIYMMPDNGDKRFFFDQGVKDIFNYTDGPTVEDELFIRDGEFVIAPVERFEGGQLTESFGMPVNVPHGRHTVKAWLNDYFGEQLTFNKFVVSLFVDNGNKMTIEEYTYTDEKEGFPTEKPQFEILVGEIPANEPSVIAIRLTEYE